MLSAAKGEASRLKNEKFDLINEMKDLYEALEHKEKQLHDFMRTYDHVSIFTAIRSFDGQMLIGTLLKKIFFHVI